MNLLRSAASNLLSFGMESNSVQGGNEKGMTPPGKPSPALSKEVPVGAPEDSARLDWLEQNQCDVDAPVELVTPWHVFGRERFEGKTLRSAIDAAMSASPVPAASEVEEEKKKLE